MYRLRVTVRIQIAIQLRVKGREVSLKIVFREGVAGGSRRQARREWGQEARMEN